jgi:hypothetical protein
MFCGDEHTATRQWVGCGRNQRSKRGNASKEVEPHSRDVSKKMRKKVKEENVVRSVNSNAGALFMPRRRRLRT